MKRVFLAAFAAFTILSTPLATAAPITGPGYGTDSAAQVECSFLYLHQQDPTVFRGRGDVGRFGVRLIHFLLGIGGHLNRPKPANALLAVADTSGSGFVAEYSDDDLGSLLIVGGYYGVSNDQVIANATAAMNWLVRIGGVCRANIAPAGAVSVPEPPAPLTALAATPTEAALTQLLARLTVADPDPSRPGYNRDSWDEGIDADGDCQRTRHEVLIAESMMIPTMTANGCSVVSGFWVDRFTGIAYGLATDVQVDHLVALADAHRSGGWAWDAKRKQDFSNNISYPGQLGAVGGTVNSAKSDNGPGSWTPPGAAQCGYALDYATIKADWGLTVTQSDFDGIVRQLRTCAGISATFNASPSGPSPAPVPIVPIAAPVAQNCHPSYHPCIHDVGYDLDCPDIGQFVWVRPGYPDTYNFDGNDYDGLGCESFPKLAAAPTW